MFAEETRTLPTVMIYQSPRSAELRGCAMAAVTEALVGAYGLLPEQIHVYFHEVPDDRWGRGGKLASDSGGGPPRATLTDKA